MDNWRGADPYKWAAEILLLNIPNSYMRVVFGMLLHMRKTRPFFICSTPTLASQTRCHVDVVEKTIILLKEMNRLEVIKGREAILPYLNEIKEKYRKHTRTFYYIKMPPPKPSDATGFNRPSTQPADWVPDIPLNTTNPVTFPDEPSHFDERTQSLGPTEKPVIVNDRAGLDTNQDEEKSLKVIKSKKYKKSVASAPPVSVKDFPKRERRKLPAGVTEELWGEFRKYRTFIKAPLSDYAESLQIGYLEDEIAKGHDPVMLINLCIASGKWKKFYPPSTPSSSNSRENKPVHSGSNYVPVASDKAPKFWKPDD